MKLKKQQITRKRLFVTALVVILLVGAAALTLYLTKSGPFAPEPYNDSSDKDAYTTSQSPSAQADYSDGEPKDPGNTLNENQGSAIITDNNGQASSNTSNPIVSSTGEITVYLPGKNATIASGQEVSGRSTLPSVSFRLIDSATGMIATGSLRVVEGKFSGTLNFSTGAPEGRLDIYGAREDSTEFSNIEIPVRFKQ